MGKNDMSNEVWLWTALNWVVICVLMGLVLWKHNEILETLGPHATVSALQPYNFDFLTASYTEWYVERLHNKTALWWPDVTAVYVLGALFVILTIYAIIKGREDNNIVLNFWFALPNVIMGAQMVYLLQIDTRLYLNVLPKTPLCGCLNSTPSFPSIYDCQCYVPFHDEPVRIITANPTNVSSVEFSQAGVSEHPLPSGNLTIKYIAEEHDVESLNTWESNALSVEFAFVQSSVFAVLVRLRQYYLLHKDVLDKDDSFFFGAIISHFYYMMAEVLDALSLFQEFTENGYYFVNQNTLLYYTFWCILIACTFLMSANMTYPCRDPSALAVNIQQTLGKTIVIALCNVGLLIIRFQIIALYGDVVKVGIIFALFTAREIGMLCMGVIELGYEWYALCKGERSGS